MGLARQHIKKAFPPCFAALSMVRHYLDSGCPPMPENTDNRHDPPRCSKVQKYDAIVDEAQDVMNLADLEVLDQVLDSGLSVGRWSFFYDNNNQVGLIGRWEPEALELLQSFGALHVPLTRNCRNTRPIVEEIIKLTKCDMGATNQGNGPEVQKISVPSTQALEDILEQTLSQLLASGVSSSQITILSPLPWHDSCVSRLSDRALSSITQLDDYSMREFPSQQISFARVHDFKGLENTAIILVDIDESIFSQSPPSIMYVGMSRARAYLILLTKEL